MSDTPHQEQALTTQPQPVIEQRGDDLHVTAENPEEMELCQSALVAWCENKVRQCQEEHDELNEAFLKAANNKWNTKALGRARDRAFKRLLYYSKILTALKQGYHIVPNFPISMFAIRTTRKNVKFATSQSRWDSFQQAPTNSPEGAGEYKNPTPIVWQRTSKDESGKEVKTYWPEEWNDIEFPISMSKPKVIEATTRAMALKVFDEIGILPGVQKGDPMIIARINLQTSKWNVRSVSFIIGWHLNTRDL